MPGYNASLVTDITPQANEKYRPAILLLYALLPQQKFLLNVYYDIRFQNKPDNIVSKLQTNTVALLLHKFAHTPYCC